MGLIACHTFPDHRFWHSWRMPGNPFYWNGQWPIITESIPACRDSNIWPLRRLIVLHAQDSRIIWQTVRNATFTRADLAYDVDGDTWRLCRGNVGAMAISTGREELRKWTPRLLFRKGGQRIPWVSCSSVGPPACAQCTGLRHPMRQTEETRITLWNRTGWTGFYSLLDQ
jgi:hypothetical protein